MASLTAGAAAAQAQVGERLSSAGFALDDSVLAEYRPAEPAQLQEVPRAVLRIDLPDPRAGWLVIYDPGNALAAEQAGTAFANYLASNFGQASYPSDAQFVLNQVGGTLLFGWWAPSRLTDPDGTRAAYEALRGVGQRVPIGR